jgi:hypothetical protein
LNPQPLCGSITGCNAQNRAVGHPRRPRAGELIVNLCSRRAVVYCDLKATISQYL